MCVASAPAGVVRPSQGGSSPGGYFGRGERGASLPGERLRLTGRPPVRNSPVAVFGRGEGDGTFCAIIWNLLNCELSAKALPCTDAEESVAALEEASDASSSLSCKCCHCRMGCHCGHCCHCMGCHCCHEWVSRMEWTGFGSHAIRHHSIEESEDAICPQPTLRVIFSRLSFVS